MLREGGDCITDSPEERWVLPAHLDPDAPVPSRGARSHGGFVSDVDCFDADFFGVSTVEAARLEPQLRLVLQTVWHALEDAGQSADELRRGVTGVFLAVSHLSETAGRVAQLLGLQGPCFVVDTACSGALVALHLARKSILAGECDAAIVVGVSDILHPGLAATSTRVGLLSRTGCCRAFDADADGIVRGEGCVAVLLRRASHALARGDRVRASVVGTALHQQEDGGAAPADGALEHVLRLALSRAGLRPSELSYVEAHGVGVPACDAAEMRALVSVFGPGRSSLEPLYVGSSKGNFGHLGAAAGLLSLVKAALSLEREQLFPSLHFQALNPAIELGGAPLHVSSSLQPWLRGARPRVAGVSACGYSGTHAHVLLREAPDEAALGPRAPARPCELLLLSAHSVQSLVALVDRWTAFLARDNPPPLGDIAFTANLGRALLQHRLAVTGTTRAEWSAKLRAWREGRAVRAAATPHGEERQLLERVGERILAGEPVRLEYLYACSGHRRVSLPLYPFRRDRYWLSAAPPRVEQRVFDARVLTGASIPELASRDLAPLRQPAP